ncbi:MAG: hypothetical protein ACI4KF_08380 [Huintestinicola sp.]
MRGTKAIVILAMCAALTACSNSEDTPHSTEISLITVEEKTDMLTEAPQGQQGETAEGEAEAEAVQTGSSSDEEVNIDITEELVSETSRLMGVLDYIDCIGGGNIPKDENDTIEVGGRQYARVQSQFENTADLKQYMEDNLSEELIRNRYSHILGGEQPYYIDADGGLYGYVTAMGCGYTWIMENGEPSISITVHDDQSFTAVTKFDNYGGECEMKLDIVLSDGLRKIASISYDGVTF